jgi:2-oxoglutarate dehydrogenase E2 component (dihydrolipoamide succinyltransferase)
MKIEIIVPSAGESITQVQIAAWLTENGQFVEKNTEIAEIESDKATLAISAPESGILNIIVKEGETVNIGQVIGNIETDAEKPQNQEEVVVKTAVNETIPEDKSIPSEKTTDAEASQKLRVTPLAKNIITQNNLNTSEISKSITTDRISRKNVLDYLSSAQNKEETAPPKDKPGVIRTKMSPLRQKLAERLVSVRLNTAMLTTFNEVNMKEVLQIKSAYSDKFKQKFGFSLGLVSFFAKASAMAIKDFPAINSMIDNGDILSHDFVDINIAVSSPKGLITPIVRNVQDMTVPQIEQIIKEYGKKASINRISMDDLAIGTFTVTNGGVFGSMMSTPIINPPQSAILGMHKVSDRAMVVNGGIEILPMMYIALSYDHRLIDGKEAVGFVVKLKEILENPYTSGLTYNKEFDDFLG